LVDAAYGDKAMSISQINQVMKVGEITLDQHHSNAKKTKGTGNVVGVHCTHMGLQWGPSTPSSRTISAS
jgi:hypothetical protein